MPSTVRVCSIDELEPGQVKRAPTRIPIAVYNIDGEFYATSDTCSHEKSSLSEEGYVDGDQIECGWHYAKFYIRTGAVSTPPATKPLETYEVRIDDGGVHVVVPDA
jgi:nitrite reductase/ring-hydroxylating ferredoxin subunit